MEGRYDLTGEDVAGEGEQAGDDAMAVMLRLGIKFEEELCRRLESDRERS
jgi:hypothetical protein